MENKNEETKSSKRKSLKTAKWAPIISTLIGMLGSILRSLSLVGLKNLSSQQITIFASIFVAIVLIAISIQRLQKMGEKTRKLCRRIEEAYISQLNLSFIKPEQK
jgi:uncharacterized membrane protein